MVPRGDSKNTMIRTHTKHGIMMVNILKHHESFMLAHAHTADVIFCPVYVFYHALDSLGL